MARLSDKIITTVFNLQRQLLEGIDEATATEFTIFEQFGETDLTIREFEQLQNVRDRADSYYSRLSRTLQRIYESQPIASAANLELLGRFIEAAQANFQWLNSLTPRQYYLQRAISEVCWNYYQQTGSGIFPNEQNLLVLMQQIGAYPQEASWIYTRLQHHYSVAETLDKSDRVLQNTQNRLACTNAGGGVNCWR